jgi:hypothetical protein
MWVKNIRIAIAYWVGWLLCICLISYYDTIDEYRNTEKVEAIVIDKLMRFSRHKQYYYPQFRFEYNGSRYLFAKRGKPYFSSWSIGEKATAIFPKGQPGEAKVYSFFSYWVSLSKIFFSFMIALFLFVIPVFLRWYAEFNRKRRRMP